MNLSEEQAKEILDFLASKYNCYICHFVEFYSHRFMLYMRENETGHPRVLLYGNNWDNIFSQQESYASYLEACLDVAQEHDIVIQSIEKYDVFMSKNISIEQILIDMDLSANI